MSRPNVIEVLGHSQNVGFGTVSPEFAWPALVAAELGSFDANQAANGLVLAGHLNGFSRYIRPAAALRNRQAAPYVAPADVVIAHVGIADLANNYINGGVVTPIAFQNAFRAALAFAQLAAHFDAEPAGASHPSIAYGGTWVDVTSTDKNTGAGWREALTGATLTITVPPDFPGGELCLFWVILPAAFGSGAVWTINVTGATTVAAKETITTADADQVATGNYNLKATRLTNLNPGAHTITATAAITNLGCGFNGWGIRAPAPPELVVIKQPRLLPANYQAWLGPGTGDTPDDAAVDRLNRDLQNLAVAAGAHWLEFPELLLDPARYTVDGAHPNEIASRQFADIVLDFLDDLPDTSRSAPLAPLPTTLTNGWGNDTAPYGSLTVRRAAPRRITLTGRAKRTGTPTVGETIATLPEGTWPATSHAFACPGSTATAVVTAAPDGTLKYTAGTLGAGATVDLDGIGWTVGQ